jgi:hypothetical protein
MKHPIQKTKIDKSGVLRFVQNDVVNMMMELLEKYGIGLNELHVHGRKICRDDWDQFNQLIGSSVYRAQISDAIRDIALEQHKTGRTESELRAERAEMLLKKTRLALRDGLANLYATHPDNLMELDDTDDDASNAVASDGLLGGQNWGGK